MYLFSDKINEREKFKLPYWKILFINRYENSN